MIVLVADHGEEFLDHGGFWHGLTLYEEQIHVPLLVKWRKDERLAPPEAAGVPARLIDVAPTLLARAGAGRPPRCRASTSPATSPARNESQRMVFAEENHEGNVLRAVRTERWKWIEANGGNPRGLPNASCSTSRRIRARSRTWPSVSPARWPSSSATPTASSSPPSGAGWARPRPPPSATRSAPRSAPSATSRGPSATPPPAERRRGGFRAGPSGSLSGHARARPVSLLACVATCGVAGSAGAAAIDLRVDSPTAGGLVESELFMAELRASPRPPAPTRRATT